VIESQAAMPPRDGAEQADGRFPVSRRANSGTDFLRQECKHYVGGTAGTGLDIRAFQTPSSLMTTPLAAALAGFGAFGNWYAHVVMPKYSDPEATMLFNRALADGSGDWPAQANTIVLKRFPTEQPHDGKDWPRELPKEEYRLGPAGPYRVEVQR
jgi:hypothetical protein